jgi:hypothetical protein
MRKLFCLLTCSVAFNVTPFAQQKLSALGFDKDSMEVEKVILGSDKIS